MPGARWFPGARLNFAEHVFRDRPAGDVAIVHASERDEPAELSWGELEADDRPRSPPVCVRSASGPATGWSPTCRTSPRRSPRSSRAPRSGAIWSSCSPDFGVRTVVDRFAQIEPKVLLAVDGYRYGGRDFDRREVLQRLQDEIPSLEHTVVLGYLDTGTRPRRACATPLSWARSPGTRVAPAR